MKNLCELVQLSDGQVAGGHVLVVRGMRVVLHAYGKSGERAGVSDASDSDSHVPAVSDDGEHRCNDSLAATSDAVPRGGPIVLDYDARRSAAVSLSGLAVALARRASDLF